MTINNKSSFTIVLILIFSAISFAQSESVPSRIAKGIINREAENLPKPEYPAVAMDMKIGGEVKVEIEIDKEGNVVSAKAVSGHPLLRNVSEEAANLAKFKPTLLDGEPVSVTGTLLYKFNLPKISSPKNYGYGLELQPMGIALMFEVYNNFNSDTQLNKLINGLYEEFRVFPEVTQTNGKFTDLPLDERKKIAEHIKSIIRVQYKNSVDWQLQTGEIFGAFMGKTMSRLKNDKKLTGAELQDFITKLDTQILTVPQTFPKSVLEHFKKIKYFPTQNNMNSLKNQDKFLLLMTELFKVISLG